MSVRPRHSTDRPDSDACQHAPRSLSAWTVSSFAISQPTPTVVCLLLRLAVAFAFATTRMPKQAADDPRALLRSAVSAIEGDSVPKVAARWRARVARDSSDRPAAFGLATVARLSYDYPDAERGYTRLFNGAHDRYAVYARLGIALGFEMRSFNRDAVSAFDRARNAAHELGDRIAESEALLHLAWIRGAIDGIRTMEALLDTVVPLLPDSVLDLQAALVNRRARTSSMHGRTAESFAKADSSKPWWSAIFPTRP